MTMTTAERAKRRYEAMFLVESGLASKDWDGAEAHMKGLVERCGGKILVSGRWDERKLAYDIRGARRATYWLSYFEGPPGAANVLKQDAGLSETVLRCLVLAMDPKDEVPPDVTVRRTAIFDDEVDAPRMAV